MSFNNRLYYKYSDYLKDQYGEKVYKLPINIKVSCPNRDGNHSINGCSFCSEVGTGFESLSNEVSVKDQLLKNKEYIKQKFKAKKYIAYFQNFTNTYMPLDMFKTVISQAILPDIVEIAISTRPDCINSEYLDFLQEIKNSHNVNITIELGLQTVNYHTLEKINRGHGLSEYIDAILTIKQYGFKTCTHLILNLPWDNEIDVLESAKIISILNVEEVKLHSLYIAKNTELAKLYNNKEISIISMKDYIDRVILFLEHINSNIAVQRLVSRAPEENTLFCNWNTSWWKIRDEIEDKMIASNNYQGRLYHYRNGHALNKFK